MWKYGNIFLRQKFSNWKHSLSWRVIAVQDPVVCNIRSDSLDTNDLLKFNELCFYPSPILLQSSWLNRRSLTITARTTSTFSTFVDEIGLPERRSCSTDSRLSLKALCHLKTIVRNVCTSWGIVELKTRFETCITKNDVNSVSWFHLS
jgi:hypothetical protein